MKDTLSQLPGYLLRRASTSSLTALNIRLKKFGVRATEASILTLIAANENITQSDIGEKLAIKRANMTPIIARLESQGWIIRKRIDGRSQALSLSETGASIQAQIWAEMQSFENGLLAKIPEAHREHLLPALRALWE